jgi:phosphoribosylanthranilate isomerase
VFVKICGVRTLEDALWAAEAGADAIGFNFWPGSKRYLPVEEAGRIAKKLPARLRTVGVFVDADEREILKAFQHGAVDFVQLHGQESPDFCRKFAGRYMKALSANEEALEALDSYLCDYLLIDADARSIDRASSAAQPPRSDSLRSPIGPGGTGIRADIEVARRIAQKRRILLAGGLTADNVAEAIRVVRPFGVDVASGVESSPGVKDRTKVASFITAAKSAK